MTWHMTVSDKQKNSIWRFSTSGGTGGTARYILFSKVFFFKFVQVSSSFFNKLFYHQPKFLLFLLMIIKKYNYFLLILKCCHGHPQRRLQQTADQIGAWEQQKTVSMSVNSSKEALFVIDILHLVQELDKAIHWPLGSVKINLFLFYCFTKSNCFVLFFSPVNLSIATWGSWMRHPCHAMRRSFYA